MLPLENFVRFLYARDYVGGNTNVALWDPSAPAVPNTNMTMSAWLYYQGNTGSNRRLIKNGTSNGLGLGWQSTNDRLQIIVEGVAWAGNQIAVPANVWTHVALSRGGGNATFWMNSVAQSINSVSPAGPSGNICACGNNAGSGCPDAICGEFAWWSAELAAHEILALSKGVSPKMVRPGSLQLHYPVWGDSVEIDLSGKNRTASTFAGSAPKAGIHPPVGPPIHIAT